MSFNVNDLAAGYENVTSLFGLSARDQTILLFRRLLTETEHELLLASGKTRCSQSTSFQHIYRSGENFRISPWQYQPGIPLVHIDVSIIFLTAILGRSMPNLQLVTKNIPPNMRSSHVSTRSRRWVTVNRKRGIDTWQTSTTISSNNSCHSF
ncbi:hypothetical protein F3P66_17760 [Agrobacterium fabrum]|uniref:Uncharacterized protein n=1 Tax=Agrobacterium fabrum (strain C58 / ATCC 33970) TaxID=176299 RepID=Q8U4W7_AGRFC|nr:hypothetical protein Atu3644 [Agrobacterium fabrum str. C58]QRM61295.1 hypothetical protein F3P66_17760 [Agrobacterium fabrum]TRB30219.1 hypothetical protein EXN51_10595 [Agrobacterium fabrum]